MIYLPEDTFTAIYRNSSEQGKDLLFDSSLSATPYIDRQLR